MNVYSVRRILVEARLWRKSPEPANACRVGSRKDSLFVGNVHKNVLNVKRRANAADVD
jgi:hypothetical protein